MCFNPSPVRRVPSPDRYTVVARFCFCKNNKRTIDQERQRIVQRRLQRLRKAAECSPGQLQIEAEQCQRRVACVEGRLAARAGEAQRVARQRLAAHAATQGTRYLSLSGVRGHAGYAQDVCGEGSRAKEIVEAVG